GSDALAKNILAANTVAQAFDLAIGEGLALGNAIAAAAWQTAAEVIADTGMSLEIAVFDRDQRLVGHAPFAPAHD
ncbi:MAG TPA: cobalt-precorrin-5B (C(1))-methyltransferase, partial [Xanthobacteraceae bacterium]|nr:cobalt-precorrin-5B (C(1))-methyltransferase [Xanthobacteraceae bacterium]